MLKDLKDTHYGVPCCIDEGPDTTFLSMALEEDSKIQEYQNKCKNEAFELFSKWFWALWD